MLRRCFLVLAGLALLAVFEPAGSASADDEAGFVDIFNGRDLTGWVIDGTKTYGAEKNPCWTVEDGNLTCWGHGFGFLRYDQPAADFVLRVEYRIAKGGNSGVGIRGRVFTGDSKTRPSLYSYELQLLDDAGKTPDVHSTASLYRYVAPTSNPVKPSPEWNTLEVECVGPRIKVTLNGVVVQDVDQSANPKIKDKPLAGYVSVQNHGSKIEFRKVAWKVLAETPTPAPTAAVQP